MSDTFTDEDLRKAMFVPCASKGDLHSWIDFYLHLNIPDCVVDEESTASPMDVIWEMYNDALVNEEKIVTTEVIADDLEDPEEDDDEAEPKRLLAYGCRDGFKTLGAAIMEVLCIVHLERSVAHMAAIESQAQKAQRYVKKFFDKRYLRDYVVTKNERRCEFVHFMNPETGDHITQAQWDELLPIQRDGLVKKENYIQVLVCTMQGTNSEHVPFMVIDEVDVVDNPKAYEEAKYIPAPFEGKHALTLLVSTRKTAFGLVQKEIDKAAKTGLQIRHWNIIDVTRRCSPKRHRPNEPRVDLYRSEEELNHFTEADFRLLDPKTQEKYVQQKGAYAGCAKCPLFAMCKGRLATEQKSKSKLLKPITHVIHEFAISSLENAQAQLMSRKPASTGLIYPRLTRELHTLTASEMAKRIVGDDAPSFLDKEGLILLLKAQGALFFSGLDWGFTHSFVIVSGAIWGLSFFIFDVISQTGLDPEEKLAVAERIKHWEPTIFADPEAPDQIKLFKKKQFAMRDWKKTPGSVSMGIDIVRMKLRPAIGEPQLFMLAGDPGCELLFDRLSKYHFKQDSAGNLTEQPDEQDDDEPDACRYVVMNLFIPRGRVTASDDKAEGTTITEGEGPPPGAQPTVENHLQYFINQHLAQGLQAGGDPSTKRGRKGRIFWSMD